MKWTKAEFDPYCWHRWFAWHPVKVGSHRTACTEFTTYVWLQKIERRAVGCCDGYSYGYRELP